MTGPSTNGMTTFSLHSLDDSSARLVEELSADRGAHAGLLADDPAAVDPETAARQFLDRALHSDAVPALTAPSQDRAGTTFRTIDTETVPLTGTRVVKFRQTLNRIPVYGSLVSVELDDDNSLLGIDSALGEPQGVDPVASVAPADALRAVTAEPGGYRPTLDGVVPRLNYYYDRSASTWRLVYLLQDVPVTADARSGGARAGAPESPHIVDYVVDAHDATVVAVLPRTPGMAGEQQKAVDSFGDIRAFVASPDGDHLVLFDPDHNVMTYDFRFADPEVHEDQLPGAVIGNPPDWTPEAVSAHANAVAVSDFLRTVLRRDNIDNRGGVIISTINCVVARSSPGPKQWVNAFWNGHQMVYGQVLRPDGLRSLAANPDVVGHEMFHGVTDHTARLEYRLQSGAMNESYSDIAGTVVANRGNDDPRTWDWQVGEKLKVGDKPLRDMSNPPLFHQPDHMRDFRVLPVTQQDDWGGVHVNSGIHNKAAYNLFTAENPDGTLALTPDEAIAVFYLAMTQRLTRTSQFLDGRQAVVSSARTLFRKLPPSDRALKLAAVNAAFDAVGIV